MQKIWQEETGGLTFEWIFVLTALVIGILGGLAVMRDALITEASESANAVLTVDASYTVESPLKIELAGGEVTDTQKSAGAASGFQFESQDLTTQITVPEAKTLEDGSN